jgi:hypothetical protein
MHRSIAVEGPARASTPAGRSTARTSHRAWPGDVAGRGTGISETAASASDDGAVRSVVAARTSGRVALVPASQQGTRSRRSTFGPSSAKSPEPVSQQHAQALRSLAGHQAHGCPATRTPNTSTASTKLRTRPTAPIPSRREMEVGRTAIEGQHSKLHATRHPHPPRLFARHLAPLLTQIVCAPPRTFPRAVGSASPKLVGLSQAGSASAGSATGLSRVEVVSGLRL